MSVGSHVEGVDVQKAVKMALVHDLAEAKVGDLVIVGDKQDKISKEEKARIELETMEQVAKDLGEAFGQEVLDLFNEFEERETPTAKFLADLDKLEMLVQAEEYETTQNMSTQFYFLESQNQEYAGLPRSAFKFVFPRLE